MTFLTAKRCTPLVIQEKVITFALEGGGGTPPVPLEPSKRPLKGGFFVMGHSTQ